MDDDTKTKVEGVVTAVRDNAEAVINAGTGASTGAAVGAALAAGVTAAIPAAGPIVGAVLPLLGKLFGGFADKKGPTPEELAAMAARGEAWYQAHIAPAMQQYQSTLALIPDVVRAPIDAAFVASFRSYMSSPEVALRSAQSGGVSMALDGELAELEGIKGASALVASWAKNQTTNKTRRTYVLVGATALSLLASAALLLRRKRQ